MHFVYVSSKEVITDLGSISITQYWFIIDTFKCSHGNPIAEWFSTSINLHFHALCDITTTLNDDANGFKYSIWDTYNH